MDLGVLGDMAVSQSPDHVQLPERPLPVERTLMDAGHLFGQPPLVAGRRQSDLADVVIQIEVGILDPVRLIEAERDLHQAAA